MTTWGIMYGLNDSGFRTLSLTFQDGQVKSLLLEIRLRFDSVVISVQGLSENIRQDILRLRKRGIWSYAGDAFMEHTFSLARVLRLSSDCSPNNDCSPYNHCSPNDRFPIFDSFFFCCGHVVLCCRHIKQRWRNDCSLKCRYSDNQ
jgi:hypothetical protein